MDGTIIENIHITETQLKIKKQFNTGNPVRELLEKAVPREISSLSGN